MNLFTKLRKLFLFLLVTTKTHRFEYTRVWWYIGKTKVQKKETG